MNKRERNIKKNFILQKSTRIVLILLLIILNLVLRIPSFTHEYGTDSFVIHILGHSISQFGYAKWWLSPLSIFGLYPFSECSSVPFILSGISQTTGLDIEKVILLFDVFLGLSAIFAGYILAGVIWNNDTFKLLVAFGLSTCPAMLNYLTWTITARAPFIALLPIFTYALLNSRKYRLRFMCLAGILFALLFTTHHLVYFLIPVLIAYLFVTFTYKLKHIRFRDTELPEKYSVFVILILFLIMFAIPFFTRHFIEGSRYEAINELFLGNLPRYTGVMGIFAVGGFVYLLVQNKKSFEEWNLLVILMFLTPFLYIETYMKWFIPCFIFPLVGIGLVNTLNSEQRRKYAILLLFIFLLLSVSFSSFYQHWRTKGGSIHPFMDYMRDSTYVTALWVKENIDDGKLLSNNIYSSIEILAISGVPMLSGYYDTPDLVYGFANTEGYKLVKKPILSESFWFDGPYAKVGGYSAKYIWNDIAGNDYTYYKHRYASKFNFTHFIDKKIYNVRISSYIREHKNKIYDNGDIYVWKL